MEMPCRCECGEWFDLHDGCRVRGSNLLVCEDCGCRCKRIEELQDEIEELEQDIDNGYVKKREGKKRLKELNAELSKLFPS